MQHMNFDLIAGQSSRITIQPDHVGRTSDGNGIFLSMSNADGHVHGFMGADDARKIRDGLIERYGVPVDDENDEEPLEAWERELLEGSPEFEKGDKVQVSMNPGTKPEPGSGYVASEFAGIVGTVTGPADEEACYPVEEANGYGDPLLQWIHPAHLTKVEEEPEPKRFEPGDRVRLTGPHYIADGQTHVYNEAPNGFGSTATVLRMEQIWGADASVHVQWDGGRCSSFVATSSLSPVEASTAVFDMDGDVWVETGEGVFQMVQSEGVLGTSRESLDMIEEDYGIDNGLLPIGTRVKVTHAVHIIDEDDEPRIATIVEHVWSRLSTGIHPYLVEFENGGRCYARDVEPYSKEDEEADKMKEALRKAADDLRRRMTARRYFLDEATSLASYSWDRDAKPARLKEGDVVKVIDDRGHTAAKVGTFGKVESVAVDGGSFGRSLLSVRIFGGAPVTMFEHRFQAAPDYCKICEEECGVPGFLRA